MLLGLPARIVVALLLLAPQSHAGGENANPTLLQAVAPTYPRSRFSNPARTVLVGLIVNVAGTPENVHIVRSGGDRFDKNAIDTVGHYKFKPALVAGQPVARDIQIEVNYKAR